MFESLVHSNAVQVEPVKRPWFLADDSFSCGWTYNEETITEQQDQITVDDTRGVHRSNPGLWAALLHQSYSTLNRRAKRGIATLSSR
jgi:hypothetical protein